MSHIDEIREAIQNAKRGPGIDGLQQSMAAKRSPIEDASQEMHMAIADFYVLISRVSTDEDAHALSETIKSFRPLVDAVWLCANRKIGQYEDPRR